MSLREGTQHNDVLVSLVCRLCYPAERQESLDSRPAGEARGNMGG